MNLSKFRTWRYQSCGVVDSAASSRVNLGETIHVILGARVALTLELSRLRCIRMFNADHLCGSSSTCRSISEDSLHLSWSQNTIAWLMNMGFGCSVTHILCIIPLSFGVASACLLYNDLPAL